MVAHNKYSWVCNGYIVGSEMLMKGVHTSFSKCYLREEACLSSLPSSCRLICRDDSKTLSRHHGSRCNLGIILVIYCCITKDHMNLAA